MAYSVVATNLLDKPILQGLDQASSTALHTVGYTVKAASGQEYTYAQLSTTISAVTAGGPVFNSLNTSDWIVNSTAAGSGGERFAGLITKAVTSTTPGTNYVWIQTAGRAPDASASLAVGAAGYATTGSMLLAGAVSESSTNIQINCIALEASNGSNLADIMLKFR